MASKPEYSEVLLLRLIRETNSLDDLVSLCDLINVLESQNDLVITNKIVTEVQRRQRTFIHGDDLLEDTMS